MTEDFNSDLARNSEHTATDCMMRAVTNFDKDNVDRVVIVTLDGDGYTVCVYSNAHSDPEMLGMLYAAIGNNSGPTDED